MKTAEPLFFELPLDAENENIEKENRQDVWFPVETPSEAETFSTNHYSIIIVEDKKELSSFLKESLQESFKNVYVAGDGEEAIEIINQKHPTSSSATL